MRWLACLVLLAPLCAPAQAPDFTRVVREQAGTVVVIAATYATPPVLPDVPHDEPVAGLLERIAAGGLAPDFDAPPLGSGFIVSPDGYIVTSYHIVEDAAGDEVVVSLADGREYLGKVLGMDRSSDIALVRINAQDLPHVRIGDPARLQPGEWVAAIGTPFGLRQTVAAGIVSTPARAIPSETHIRFIQSDVALNPGHSGGPLFNLDGEVVGVNSLIFSHTGGSIGLSFAVPIDLAMQVVAQLRTLGAVPRGRLGVRLQELTAELARAFGLARGAGVLVTAVDRQGPAEAAGLRAGDVVLRFAGHGARSPEALTALVAATAPGSEAAVELVRDGAPVTVMVRLGAPDDGRPPPPDTAGTDRLGFRLVALPEPLRRRLGLESGVVLQRAAGAARRAGLYPGDIIISVNARPVASPEALQAVLQRARPGDALALLVERGGSRAFVPLRVP